jgi:hypothetical protein
VSEDRHVGTSEAQAFFTALLREWRLRLRCAWRRLARRSRPANTGRG